MAFEKKEMNDYLRIISLMLIALPLAASTNIDCSGKAFHCVNSTHFMICVDLGGGVSSTIDGFVIPCPLLTECRDTNHFECEFPILVPPVPVIDTTVNLDNNLEATTVHVDAAVFTTPFKETGDIDLQGNDLNIASINSTNEDGIDNHVITPALEISTTDAVNIVQNKNILRQKETQDHFFNILEFTTDNAVEPTINYREGLSTLDNTEYTTAINEITQNTPYSKDLFISKDEIQIYSTTTEISNNLFNNGEGALFNGVKNENDNKFYSNDGTTYDTTETVVTVRSQGFTQSDNLENENDILNQNPENAQSTAYPPSNNLLDMTETAFSLSTDSSNFLLTDTTTVISEYLVHTNSDKDYVSNTPLNTEQEDAYNQTVSDSPYASPSTDIPPRTSSKEVQDVTGSTMQVQKIHDATGSDSMIKNDRGITVATNILLNQPPLSNANTKLTSDVEITTEIENYFVSKTMSTLESLGNINFNVNSVQKPQKSIDADITTSLPRTSRKGVQDVTGSTMQEQNIHDAIASDSMIKNDRGITVATNILLNQPPLSNADTTLTSDVEITTEIENYFASTTMSTLESLDNININISSVQEAQKSKDVDITTSLPRTSSKGVQDVTGSTMQEQNIHDAIASDSMIKNDRGITVATNILLNRPPLSNADPTLTSYVKIPTEIENYLASTTMSTSEALEDINININSIQEPQKSIDIDITTIESLNVDVVSLTTEIDYYKKVNNDSKTSSNSTVEIFKPVAVNQTEAYIPENISKENNLSLKEQTPTSEGYFVEMMSKTMDPTLEEQHATDSSITFTPSYVNEKVDPSRPELSTLSTKAQNSKVAITEQYVNVNNRQNKNVDARILQVDATILPQFTDEDIILNESNKTYFESKAQENIQSTTVTMQDIDTIAEIATENILDSTLESMNTKSSGLPLALAEQYTDSDLISATEAQFNLKHSTNDLEDLNLDQHTTQNVADFNKANIVRNITDINTSENKVQAVPFVTKDVQYDINSVQNYNFVHTKYVDIDKNENSITTSTESMVNIESGNAFTQQNILDYITETILDNLNGNISEYLDSARSTTTSDHMGSNSIIPLQSTNNYNVDSTTPQVIPELYQTSLRTDSGINHMAEQYTDNYSEQIPSTDSPVPTEIYSFTSMGTTPYRLLQNAGGQQIDLDLTSQIDHTTRPGLLPVMNNQQVYKDYGSTWSAIDSVLIDSKVNDETTKIDTVSTIIPKESDALMTMTTTLQEVSSLNNENYSSAKSLLPEYEPIDLQANMNEFINTNLNETRILIERVINIQGNSESIASTQTDTNNISTLTSQMQSLLEKSNDQEIQNTSISTAKENANTDITNFKVDNSVDGKVINDSQYMVRTLPENNINSNDVREIIPLADIAQTYSQTNVSVNAVTDSNQDIKNVLVNPSVNADEFDPTSQILVDSKADLVFKSLTGSTQFEDQENTTVQQTVDETQFTDTSKKYSTVVVSPQTSKLHDSKLGNAMFEVNHIYAPTTKQNQSDFNQAEIILNDTTITHVDEAVNQKNTIRFNLPETINAKYENVDTKSPLSIISNNYSQKGVISLQPTSQKIIPAGNEDSINLNNTVVTQAIETQVPQTLISEKNTSLPKTLMSENLSIKNTDAKSKHNYINGQEERAITSNSMISATVNNKTPLGLISEHHTTKSSQFININHETPQKINIDLERIATQKIHTDIKLDPINLDQSVAVTTTTEVQHPPTVIHGVSINPITTSTTISKEKINNVISKHLQSDKTRSNDSQTNFAQDLSSLDKFSFKFNNEISKAPTVSVSAKQHITDAVDTEIPLPEVVSIEIPIPYVVTEINESQMHKPVNLGDTFTDSKNLGKIINNKVIKTSAVESIGTETIGTSSSLQKSFSSSDFNETLSQTNRTVDMENKNHVQINLQSLEATAYTIRSKLGNTTQNTSTSTLDSAQYETVNALQKQNENRSIGSTVQNYCRNKVRGRYSDREDCAKFYVCIGKLAPIVGRCPANTVFSEIRKQCTKNMAHCIRESEFKCVNEGRFSDILKENVYYICVKRTNTFIRFKFQCQNGYYLNKTLVKCSRSTDLESHHQSSISSDNSKSEKSAPENAKSSKEKSIHENGSVQEFECEKEGKFPDPNNCRKYYVCTKNKKSEFRRKRKRCDKDEAFHNDKKKCVDADSYECE